MNVMEVAKGLKEGKKYSLEEWGRFYLFAVDNAIYIKSPYTEEIIYNLHLTELESDKWIEVK